MSKNGRRGTGEWMREGSVGYADGRKEKMLPKTKEVKGSRTIDGGSIGWLVLSYDDDVNWGGISTRTRDKDNGYKGGKIWMREITALHRPCLYKF